MDILNYDNLFRTSDADYPGPSKLEPICTARGQTIGECWHWHSTTVALEFFLCCLFIRQFLEFSHGARRYLTSKENYFQTIIYILTVGFIITVPIHMGFSNHLATWAVFLQWLNITQLCGRIDFCGKLIFMAFDLAKDMGKTLLVFTPLMVAFMFAFNNMFPSHSLFNGLASTYIKLLVMMQGDTDFYDNFSYQKVKEEGGRNLSIQVNTMIFRNCQFYLVKRRLRGREGVKNCRF